MEKMTRTKSDNKNQAEIFSLAMIFFHLPKLLRPVDVTDLTVIDRPLLEPVQLEQVAFEGNVADEVEGLASVAAAGRRKDRVAAALEAPPSPRSRVRVVSL